MIRALLASALLAGWFPAGIGSSSGSISGGSSGVAAPAVISTANITLAVATTGSDTATASRPQYVTGGDYSAYPYATIQAALTALPAIRRHTVLINVGAGSFAGFGILSGANSATLGRITINGTLANVTPTTGAATGTATSGSATTLVKTGAGWTSDDFKGMFLKITAGTGVGLYMTIAKNTTDTITFVATDTSPTPDATSVFAVQYPSTLITSQYASTGAAAYVASVVGSVSILNLAVSGCTYALYALDSTNVLMRRVGVVGATIGYLSNGGSTTLDNVSAISSVTYGIGIWQAATPQFGATNVAMAYNARGVLISGNPSTSAIKIVGSVYRITGAYVRDATSADGIRLYHGSYDLDNITVDGGANGILVQASRVVGHTINISNVTAKTLDLRHADVSVDTILGGTGNAGFGINAYGAGNLVDVTMIVPTITGASGDATVDGSTVKTWAGDFGSAPSYAVDTTSGARIVRQ
jgi:hypothetical protein